MYCILAFGLSCCILNANTKLFGETARIHQNHPTNIVCQLGSLFEGYGLPMSSQCPPHASAPPPGGSSIFTEGKKWRSVFTARSSLTMFLARGMSALSYVHATASRQGVDMCIIETTIRDYSPGGKQK